MFDRVEHGLDLTLADRSVRRRRTATRRSTLLFMARDAGVWERVG